MVCISIDKEGDFSLQVMRKTGIVIAYFSAPWCEPCKTIGSEITAAAAKFAGQVRVLQVNVDALKNVAKKYDIVAVPTLLFFQGGKPVKRIIGTASQDEIVTLLTALLKNPVQA